MSWWMRPVARPQRLIFRFSGCTSLVPSNEGTACDLVHRGRRAFSTVSLNEKEKMPEAVVDLFQTIRTQSLAKLDEFTPSHLFSLIWSFAAAKMLDEKLQSAITARLQAIAAEKDKKLADQMSAAGGNQVDAGAALDISALEILSQYDNWLCLAKPSGMQVNPPTDADTRDYSVFDMSGSSMQRTIHDHLGPVFPICKDPTASYGLIHRLDMDTTGNLLVAKNWWGYYWLRLQWSSFKVLKEYVCLVHGHVVDDMDIKDRIKVTKETNPSGNVTSSAEISEDGRPAHTEVEVLGRFASGTSPYSLLKCRIHTGRTHQIRIHLSNRGFPLVSDIKYAAKCYEQDKVWCQRNFLHNYRLGVDDVPNASGQSVRRTLEAPMPHDLRAVLSSLAPQDNVSQIVLDSCATTGLLPTS